MRPPRSASPRAAPSRMRATRLCTSPDARMGERFVWCRHDASDGSGEGRAGARGSRRPSRVARPAVGVGSTTLAAPGPVGRRLRPPKRASAVLTAGAYLIWMRPSPLPFITGGRRGPCGYPSPLQSKRGLTAGVCHEKKPARGPAFVRERALLLCRVLRGILAASTALPAASFAESAEAFAESRKIWPHRPPRAPAMAWWPVGERRRW